MEPSWHFVGIQVVRPRLFAGLADNTPAETVRELYRDLVASEPGRVRVFPVSAAFHDVGTPADYLAMCEEFAGVDRHGNVCWPGATIAPAAEVRRSIVAGGALVPDGYRAADSVVVPATLARPADHCWIEHGLARFPI